MAVRTAKQVRFEVGRRIAELRHSQAWTQREFAEHLVVSEQYVRRIEGGAVNLTLDSLTHIAGKFDADARVLLDAPESLIKPSRGRPSKDAPFTPAQVAERKAPYRRSGG